MSYSRWLNSRWYTYWHSNDSCYIHEQLFSVDCSFMFTYLDLKEDLECCLKKVRKKGKKVTEEELQELKGYMQEFIEDVESCDELIKDEFIHDSEGRRIAKSQW